MATAAYGADCTGDPNNRDDADSVDADDQEDRDQTPNQGHQTTSNGDPEQPLPETHGLRLLFTASSKPPIVTFRFKATVFGFAPGGGRVKAILHFDIRRHHILSLEPVHCVDTATVPELGPDDVTKLGGAVTQIQFRLHRPGGLILPLQPSYQSLKRSSQETLEALRSLAAAIEFDLFLPRMALSQEQIQRFQQLTTSPTSDRDRQQEAGERAWWLSTLYGGTGGRLVAVGGTGSRLLAVDSAAAAGPGAADSNEANPTPDSGESTIATPTPPVYRESALPIEQSPVSLAVNTGTGTPPRYTAPKDEGSTDTADIRAGKRPLDRSPEPESRVRRRLHNDPNLASRVPSSDVARDSWHQKEPLAGPSLPFSAAHVLSQLEEVLRRTKELEEENRALKTEVATLREKMDTKLEAIAEQARHQSKTIKESMWENDDLEKRLTCLEEQHENLEDRHVGLYEKLDRMEDARHWMEQEHSERVCNEVRDKLLDALGTM